MTLSRVSATLAALAVLFMGAVLAAIAFVMATGAYEGRTYPVDFAAFWAAARFAIEGRALDAFDPHLMRAYLAIPPENSEDFWLWMYPPTWHVAVWPLGWLPFWVAYPLFAVGALVVYVRALGPYAGAWPGGLNLVLASPVVIVGTLNGNNGLLTAGILLLALSALAQGREARAGLLIALLTVKPTLGLLIPVALAAGGHWRAMLWAVLGALALGAAAAAVLGWGYWAVFAEQLGVSAQRVTEGRIPREVMVTGYAFGWAIGMGSGAALWVQSALTLACAVAVGWAFARVSDWHIKGAVLLLVTPMATPYAHFYEMGFTLAGTVLWCAAGGGRTWVDRAVIAGIWALPAASLYLREPPVIPWLAAPLATAALGLCLAQGARRRTAAP